MNGFFIFTVLCILGINAIPKPVVREETQIGRIGGGVIATTAPHACMVLVNRRNLDGTNTAALGGGSIISATHVLTAAHLVQGDNISYQVGFFVGTSRRMITTTFALIHQDWDSTTFGSDIAIIFLQGTSSFPLTNVIRIATDETVPAAAAVGITVGFGFVNATSTTASSDPYAAAQNVLDTCLVGTIEIAPTHYCAIDSASTTWVCPGDNGAGMYIEGTDPVTAPSLLVGVVSRLLAGCAAAQNTAYTRVSTFAPWIANITGVSAQTFIANYNKLRLHQL